MKKNFLKKFNLVLFAIFILAVIMCIVTAACGEANGVLGKVCDWLFVVCLGLAAIEKIVLSCIQYVEAGLQGTQNVLRFIWAGMVCVAWTVLLAVNVNLISFWSTWEGVVCSMICFANAVQLAFYSEK